MATTVALGLRIVFMMCVLLFVLPRASSGISEPFEGQETVARRTSAASSTGSSYYDVTRRMEDSEKLRAKDLTSDSPSDVVADLWSQIARGADAGDEEIHHASVVQGLNPGRQHAAILQASTTVTVRVGNYTDGPAKATDCSVSSLSALTTCNLRSAWALCTNQLALALNPCTAGLVCSIQLPGGTTSVVSSTYGQLRYEVPSTTTTSTYKCPVTIAIVSSTPSTAAIIRGNANSTRLLSVVNHQELNSTGHSNTPVSFQMQAVQVQNFGNSSLQFNASLWVNGGAVYLRNVHGVMIDKVIFGPANVGNQGGALYVQRARYVSLTNSVFYRNMASGDGGALYAQNVSTMYFSGTTWLGNMAVGNYNGGGALCLESAANVVIVGSSFTSNMLSTGPNGVALGGGGAFISYSQNITVMSTVFNFNNNTDQGYNWWNIGQPSSGGFGGGLYVSLTPTVTVFHSRFYYNAASYSGGGLYLGTNVLNVNVQYTTFSSNLANQLYQQYRILGGGGAAMCSSTEGSPFNYYIIQGCTFVNNNSPIGGVVNIAQSTLDFGATTYVMLKNSAFVGNYGGGALINQVNSATLSNCTFVGNINAIGGGLYVISTPVTSITNSIFRNNQALDSFYSGGTSNDGASSFGGAIQYDFSYLMKTYPTQASGGSLTISGCNFTSNFADNGGAISMNYAQNTVLTNLYFSGNTGNNTGGGIALAQCTQVKVMQSRFVGNRALHGNGGGIKADTVTGFKVQESSFRSNVASVSGGAISLDKNIIYANVLYTTFVSNVASTGSGGALSIGQFCSYISIGGMLPVFTSAQNTDDQFRFADFDYPAANFKIIFDQTTQANCAVDWVKVGRSAGPCYVVDDYVTRRTRQAATNFISGTSVYLFVPFGYKYYNYLAPGNYTCNSFANDAATWPGFNGHDPYVMTDSFALADTPGCGDEVDFRISITATGSYMKVAAFPVPRNAMSTAVFFKNRAGLNGGGVYVGSQNSYVFFFPGTQFTSNVAGVDGGGMHFEYQNQYVYMYTPQFTSNVAKGGGGAVAFSKTNFPVVLYDATFTGNSANAGGAVFMGAGNGNGLLQAITTDVVKFLRTTMVNNVASQTGGGLYMSTINALTLDTLTATGNRAGSSGGFAYLDSKNYLLVRAATVANSVAGGSGGAFYTYIQNSLNFTGGCAVTGSRSVGDGGGVVAALTGSIASYGALNLSGNACSGTYCAGGAMAASQQSSVSIFGATVVAGNVAGSIGGGLAISASALTLGLQPITFTKNVAAEGSAAHLGATSTTQLNISTSKSPVTFIRNRATTHGGTVSVVYDSMQKGSGWAFKRFVFKNNTAVFAPKVATQATTMTASTPLIYVTEYSADIAPAPTFVLTDLSGQRNVTDYSTSFSASVLASNCSGHYAYVSGTTMVVAKAGVATFSNLTAFCFPGGSMTVQFTAQMTPAMSGKTLYTTVVFQFRQCVDGEVLQDNQCVDCPSGTFSLQYAPDQVCARCPPYTTDCAGKVLYLEPGYWRLSPHSLDILPCPWPQGCAGRDSFVDFTVGNLTRLLKSRRLTDVVEAGYGHHSDERKLISVSGVQKYLFGTLLQEVLPMSTFGCAEGHQGPLCAVCRPNYYFSQTQAKCNSCTGQKQTQLALMIFIPLIFLMVMVFVVFGGRMGGKKRNVGDMFVASAKSEKNQTESETPAPRGFAGHLTHAASKIALSVKNIGLSGRTPRKSLTPGSQDGPIDAQAEAAAATAEDSRLRHIVTIAQRILMPKVKILLTVMQIVSGFPTVLDLHFPPSSSTLLHGFSFVNFSSLQLGSPQCYTSFDYVSTLQTQTLVPIGIVCLLALAFVLHYAYLTHQKRKRREKVILIRKYTMLVFFITYLTLPAVSTTILGAYPCVTIDPSMELPDQPAAHLMKRSYDVSCSSKRYKEGYIWAVVMTIVYPIGVTMMYCFVLYYNRFGIMVESGEDLDVLYAEQQREVTGFMGYVTTFVNRALGMRSSPAKTHAVADDDAAAPVSLPPLHGMSANEDSKTSGPGGGAVPRDDVGRAVTRQDSTGGFEIDDDTAARWLQHPYVVAARQPRKGIMRHITPKEIRFLWRMYRAKFWYWEMIETLRRLLFTAVVSVVAPGDGGQIVFAVFVSVVSLKVYGTFNPMISPEDSALLELAQYQVFFTLFISLMLRDGTVTGPAWKSGLDAALVIINISTPAACVVILIYHYFELTTGKAKTNGEHPDTITHLSSRKGSNLSSLSPTARSRRLSQLGQPDDGLDSDSDEDVVPPLPAAAMARRTSGVGGALNEAGRTPRDGAGPTTVSARQASTRSPPAGSRSGSGSAPVGNPRGSGTVAFVPAADASMSPSHATAAAAAVFEKGSPGASPYLLVADLEIGNVVTDNGEERRSSIKRVRRAIDDDRPTDRPQILLPPVVVIPGSRQT